jgi:hypothetical protein
MSFASLKTIGLWVLLHHRFDELHQYRENRYQFSLCLVLAFSVVDALFAFTQASSYHRAVFACRR